MSPIKPAIVVVSFNRPNALKRLLNSLDAANYQSKDIPLIISIDKGVNNSNVLEVAEAFNWKNGEKTVNYLKENLGLRKHIIKCASYSNDYDSVIILEDDIYVSAEFYNYAVQALSFGIDKKYIGGISLYNHQFSLSALSSFSPIEDGYDNWYFQYASSWGQAWTKEQWTGFMEWYNRNPELQLTTSVPNNITNWSDKSWLKYFIHYLVETNKYFLYPKISLSTNFSDAGTHILENSTKFQVPIRFSKQNSMYNFSTILESQACYDVFFENSKLYEVLGLEKENLCVDLYGTKPLVTSNVQFLLSSRIYNFKILKSYACQLKPRDANIINNIFGKDIFLYDTTIKEKNSNGFNFYTNLMYDIKHISRRNLKWLFLTMYFNRLRLLVRDKLGI